MRVLICDDHRLFAESLAMTLEMAGHDVVAIAPHPDQAEEVLATITVDVALVDLRYGEHEALDEVVCLIRGHPDLRVVVLSGHLDGDRAAMLRASGAWAWAVKGGALEQVLTLVHGADSTCRAVEPTDRWAADPLGRFLTRRERDVLDAVAHGESTTMLAVRFSVSHATVRTHVQSILTKLGVHTRLEAVAYAVSRSLVVLDQRLTGTGG